MSEILNSSWWLDDSGLPDLLWARLRVFADGSAEVFDLDGNYHQFGTAAAAEDWLREDEYAPLDELVAEGAVASGGAPPLGDTDRELLPLMLRRDRTVEVSAGEDGLTA